jgi:DNA repair photolyase
MTTVRQASLFEPERQLSLPVAIGAARVGASSIRSILTPGRGRTASFDFTLNVYRGCTFGCAYCYAPSFESRTELAEDWGNWVEVKLAALESLTGVDLRDKSIFMSSVTDPYQPIEAKLKLTRAIVERLLHDQARLVVQTRSPIVARDIDLLRQFRKLRVNMSIPTESDQIRRQYESAAPSIEARFRTVRRLKDAGLTVSVCICPMLPVEDSEKFARVINESGADRVTSGWFHESPRAFTATTRNLGLEKNAALRWTYADYKRVCATLAARCPAWTTPARAFAPPSLYERQ